MSAGAGLQELEVRGQHVIGSECGDPLHGGGKLQLAGIDPFAYLLETLPMLRELESKPTGEQLAELLPDAWARHCQATITVTAFVA